MTGGQMTLSSPGVVSQADALAATPSPHFQKMNQGQGPISTNPGFQLLRFPGTGPCLLSNLRTPAWGSGDRRSREHDEQDWDLAESR